MSIKKSKSALPVDGVERGAVFVGQGSLSGLEVRRVAEEDREPDLVTAIFDLLEQTHPSFGDDRLRLEDAVRVHFRGVRGTVTDRPDASTTARRVLALFNGRNAREVARKLRISRGHVYRVLKQPGSVGPHGAVRNDGI